MSFRRTPETLASHRSHTLSVLAVLHKAGRLDVDAVWIARVGSDIVEGLHAWNIGDDVSLLAHAGRVVLMRVAIGDGFAQHVNIISDPSERGRWCREDNILNACFERKPGRIASREHASIDSIGGGRGCAAQTAKFALTRFSRAVVVERGSDERAPSIPVVRCDSVFSCAEIDIQVGVGCLRPHLP